jgi:hypothetical protein
VEPLEGRYGLVRTDGVLAVPVAYAGVLWTRDGYAAVTDGETCALYDLVAAAPVGDGYEALGEYAQGYVPVEQNGLWGFLKPATGNVGDGAVWESARLSEGWRRIAGRRYGFIDLTGRCRRAAIRGVAPSAKGWRAWHRQALGIYRHGKHAGRQAGLLRGHNFPVRALRRAEKR